MTLKEWESQAKYAVSRLENGATCVPEHTGLHYRELWNLSDYVVSSVAGGMVWLTPRGADPIGGAAAGAALASIASDPNIDPTFRAALGALTSIERAMAPRPAPAAGPKAGDILRPAPHPDFEFRYIDNASADGDVECAACRRPLGLGELVLIETSGAEVVCNAECAARHVASVIGNYGTAHDNGVDSPRPAAAPAELKCPKCTSANIWHIEDVPTMRALKIYNANRAVFSASNDHGDTMWEDGADERLICRDCAHEFPFPPGVEIDFE